METNRALFYFVEVMKIDTFKKKFSLMLLDVRILLVQVIKVDNRAAKRIYQTMKKKRTLSTSICRCLFQTSRCGPEIDWERKSTIDSAGYIVRANIRAKRSCSAALLLYIFRGKALRCQASQWGSVFAVDSEVDCKQFGEYMDDEKSIYVLSACLSAPFVTCRYQYYHKNSLFPKYVTGTLFE